MPAYKDTNGTYFVSFYYEDFRGVKKRKMKRGLPVGATRWTGNAAFCCKAPPT